MDFSLNFVSASTEYSTYQKQIPAPYFRREFEINNIKTAELTICGLGFYELYINGTRITKGLLCPYISNPDHYLYYDNYDLKPYLKEGSNAIGIILGNGMQNAYGGQVWDFQTARWRSAPKFALKFEAEKNDCSKITFDASSFKCTESPIILDDLRIGEFYDARLEIEGWNEPGFDDSEWRAPIKAETPRGDCRISDVDPILPTYELTPVSVTESRISIFPNTRDNLPKIPIPEDEENNGGYLYSFAVNAAGLPRLRIKNTRPGQKIVMQFGEKLAEDGGLDMRSETFQPIRYNHRAVYICKGAEEEVYMPMFTYFGFQYCLVMGLDKEQAVEELLTYVVMNTALKPRAEFKCSSEIVNKIWDAAIVSDLANFYHFPTDCPHREKNGWTGDVALSAEQLMMAFCSEKNFVQWLNNVRKAQTENGELTGIIPTDKWGLGCGPGWDGVIITLPYYIWYYTGDKTVLKDNAHSMMRYLNFIDSKRDEKGLIHFGINDWCPSGIKGASSPRAPQYFTSLTLVLDQCRKAAEIFDLIGWKKQKEFAESLWNEYRDAIRKYNVDSNTCTIYSRGLTTQAMAIYYDVFDSSEKHFAFEKLVKMIEDDINGFDCGIFGLRVIFHVLAEYGRADLAYKLITKEEYPSYGYWIVNGRTSLGEQFIPVDEEQSSLNHHFFGDVISWFMKHLAGIQIKHAENDKIEIEFSPKFIDDLDFAAGSIDTPYGKVSAEWHRDGDEILYTVELPEDMVSRVNIAEGWKSEEGGTFWHPLGGNKTTIRIIPSKKKDKNMY